MTFSELVRLLCRLLPCIPQSLRGSQLLHCTPPAWQPPPLQGRSFIAQRLAAVIPMITGTVKFHILNLVVFWKQCEACLTAS